MRISELTLVIARKVRDLRTGKNVCATAQASLQRVKREYRETRTDMYMTRYYPESDRAIKVRERSYSLFLLNLRARKSFPIVKVG